MASLAAVFGAAAEEDGGRVMGIENLFGGGNNKPASRDVTLNNLQPGDVVMLWDGRANLVDSTLDCAERVGDRYVSWRWVFLDGGNVLEVAPTNTVLYDRMDVFSQGSPQFYKLVAEPEAGGVLKTFEERVRDGSIASAPVAFAYQRRQYRLKSTGTFVAACVGKPLAALVWADLSPNAADNVYFTMESRVGEERVLGVWTSHIAFLRGRLLAQTDIRGLYGR